MTRYTARNGTTFLLDPEAAHVVQVAGGIDDEGQVIAVDLDDLFEFVQYLEAGEDVTAPTDADCAAVGPD